MTDERVSADALMGALTRLPRGAGVIFRHYSLPPAQRRALFDAVRTIVKRRNLVLILAGSARTARAWRADGWHGRSPGPSTMLHTAPAHNFREIRQAELAGAHLLFLSPVFPTRSHPAARTLGPMRLAALLRQARRPVIALGGMTKERWPPIKQTGATGWAAIDAWSGPA
ncbi:MAG: thiamine phosphate synthase [Sphingobium sp.]|nr:thiamine phosphate synthase [Sphingobium sp.]